MREKKIKFLYILQTHCIAAHFQIEKNNFWEKNYTFTDKPTRNNNEAEEDDEHGAAELVSQLFRKFIFILI